MLALSHSFSQINKILKKINCLSKYSLLGVFSKTHSSYLWKFSANIDSSILKCAWCFPFLLPWLWHFDYIYSQDGVSGWHSQLSNGLPVLAQVVISQMWDLSPFGLCAQHGVSFRFSLPPRSCPSPASLSMLSFSQINKVFKKLYSHNTANFSTIISYITE